MNEDDSQTTDSEDIPSENQEFTIGIQRALKETKRKLSASWTTDDTLQEKFFPVDPLTKSRVAAVILDKYNQSTRRWKSFPKAPKDMVALASPLAYLLNDFILPSSKVKNASQSSGRQQERRKTHRRYVLSTWRTTVGGDPQVRIYPPLYLMGSGPEFARSSCRYPRPYMNQAMTPVDIAFDWEDKEEIYNRVAAQAWEIFNYQFNRRFVFGLLFTETVCTLFLFDRVGAVIGKPFNYHQEPDKLGALICGLSSDSDKVEKLGFDCTIFSEKETMYIQTMEYAGRGRKGTRYVIDDIIFQAPGFLGRTTTCFRIYKPEDPEHFYIIKDAWVAFDDVPGKEPEGVLLQHIKDSGVTTGVVGLIHYEECRRSNKAGDIDAVLRNRMTTNPTPEETKKNRVHNRIVMTSHGKTLDNFSTREEFILAFYDAIRAHRKLYQIAGILHRDISPRNILINAGGMDGDRGIIIDFDNAIRVDDSSQYAKESIVGTHRFMSRNLLCKGRHSYLDDLESFYYVLCWIMTMNPEPGRILATRPSVLAFWDDSDSAWKKEGHFSLLTFDTPVSMWFGEHLLGLAKRLWRWFDSRIQYLRNPPSYNVKELDPDKDYDAILTEIRRCMTEMGIEWQT